MGIQITLFELPMLYFDNKVKYNLECWEAKLGVVTCGVLLSIVLEIAWTCRQGILINVNEVTAWLRL
jgi:hypothetical protein